MTITNVTFAKEGLYRCFVVNYGGLVITRAARLRIGEGPPPDSDADGLLDAWEQQYFGDLSKGPTDDPDLDGLTNEVENQQRTNPALADTDGDGFSDHTELYAGKNPTDANSKPDAVITVFTALEVELLTQSGKTYQLQVSEDLSTWVNFDTPIPGDGRIFQKLYSIKDGRRLFYRAEILP